MEGGTAADADVDGDGRNDNGLDGGGRASEIDNAIASRAGEEGGRLWAPFELW